MGIRDRPTSPGSPWQNGHVERLIGTIWREWLDHVLITGIRHLRQVLASYAAYYNQARTHLALQKDAPLRRAVQRYAQIVTGCDFRKGQVAVTYDIAADFAVLRSNCHRMIHRSADPSNLALFRENLTSNKT